MPVRHLLGGVLANLVIYNSITDILVCMLNMRRIDYMWKTLFNEIKYLRKQFGSLDTKVVTIFVSVAILQTISWYFTSRRFFNQTLYTYFLNNENIDLYEFLYWFISDSIILFGIPVLIIKFLFKEEIKNYGVNFKNLKYGLLTILFSIIIILPVTYIVSLSKEFSNFYPMYQGLNQNIKIFLMYESFLLLFLFAWEFIWRGFMLFGLESKFGWYSIFIQMIPFVILHNGKPALETFSSILGALFLGVLALRTRSIIYGFIIHAAIIISLDIYAIL